MKSKIFFLGMTLWSGCTLAQTPVPITNPTVSSTVLSEVVDGAGTDLPVNVSQLPIEFFDDYSWRIFIALNWPAKAVTRGVADVTRPVGDLSAPRVWETWKTAYESIPSKGEKPTPWSSFDARVPVNNVPVAGGGLKRIFGSFTKFGDISQADFGSLAGPLVCQNNTFAHYEIRVNQPQFEFISSNRLYDRAVLDKPTAPRHFPDGSIEVKAAWREFNSADPESVRARYYRVKAMVKDYRTGDAVERELGLIGMHIVQKTPLRPQWVWSSFEHVDNVPPAGQPPAPGSAFSLNDSKKPQTPFPTNAVDAVSDKNYLDAANAPLITVKEKPVPTPMQVVREVPLHPKTVGMNARYQNKLSGSVWANYMLVMTQWPTDPSTPSGVPFPGEPEGNGGDLSIANTTMETYFQSDTSCMRCHLKSKKLDFVFFPLVHAQNQDPGPAGSLTREFVNGLKAEFDEHRRQSESKRAARLGQ